MIIREGVQPAGGAFRSGVGFAESSRSPHDVLHRLGVGLGIVLLCAACGRTVTAATAYGGPGGRALALQRTSGGGVSSVSLADHPESPAAEASLRDASRDAPYDAAQGAALDAARDTARDTAEDAWHYLLLQTGLGPRNPGSPGHRRLVDFLVSELAKSADDVQVQPFNVVYEGAAYSMANVTALFRSSTGGEKPFILLGAHFDTRPRAECDAVPARRSIPIVGANDGASGVAVLLEIASVLARTRPPVPVMIAFFDGEDLGASTSSMFLGSRHLAGKTDPSDVRCMVLLDMVADADLDIYIEGNSHLSSPDLVDTVWSAAERLGYGRVFHREVRYHILDDHVPFIERGIPAVDIIDFDYPYWHTTLDTPDKCSPKSLQIVRDVILDVILRDESASLSLHEPDGF